MTTHLIQLFMVLFAVINPFAALGVFLGLTKGGSTAAVRQTAIQTTLTCAVVLLLVTWLGSYILSIFGIFPHVFQITGGIILAGIGLKLVKGDEASNHEEIVEFKHKSISMIPMGLPVLTGPGTMAAIIIHVQSYFPSTLDKLAVTGVCFVQVIIIAIVLLTGPWIQKMIGEKGIDATSKMMGLILTAISVQMVTLGVLALAPKLA